MLLIRIGVTLASLEERFRFRAMIDNYSTSTELVQGNDRIVKTEFQINLLGHIISDSINSLPFNTKKYSDKTNVRITNETTTKL